MHLIDPNDFKEAMGSFPSGVVIATTLDEAGRPWGFTASAFSSVSLKPPLVLLCLAKSADCYSSFAAACVFAVNILRQEDEALARLFATRGADKFASDEFRPGDHGLPVMRNAVASLVCRRYADYDGGDHRIIVGQVESLQLGAAVNAMVYFRSRYGRFAPSGELRPSDGDEGASRPGNR